MIVIDCWEEILDFQISYPLELLQKLQQLNFSINIMAKIMFSIVFVLNCQMLFDSSFGRRSYLV